MKIPFCYTAKGNVNVIGNKIIDWHQKGRSLREIAAMIEEQYGWTFTPMTVRRFLIKENVYRTK